MQFDQVEMFILPKFSDPSPNDYPFYINFKALRKLATTKKRVKEILKSHLYHFFNKILYNKDLTTFAQKFIVSPETK